MISLTVNGITYQYPQVDDDDWGNQATLWASSVSDVLLCMRKPTLPTADFGVVRLGNTDSFSWRNFADDDNVRLYVDVDDKLYIKQGANPAIDLTANAAGNVTGPGSATDNAICRFDGTTGQLIQDSLVVASDLGAVSGITDLAISGAFSGATTISSSGLATLDSVSVTTTLSTGGLATLASLLVSGNSTLSGDVTVGDSSADTLVINALLNSDIIPLTDATLSLGSTTKNFVKICLDNGATDGGAIDFNASSTSFLKSNAAGTSLDIGGFTQLVPAVTAVTQLGASSNRFTHLSLSTNIGTSTPVSNRLYADLIPKAWAYTSSTGSLQAGVNLTVSSSSTGIYDYVFKTAMANDNYSVMITPTRTIPGIAAYVAVTSDFLGNKTTTGFSVFLYNMSNTASNVSHNVMVMGAQ